MNDRGVFLVFEGVEGAGKTTQVRRLASWLEASGIPHQVAREPGGTPVGEAIRGVLLDSAELEIPAETELLLMLAARAAFVKDVVRPTLAEGRVMVSDRFELSTLAYQAVARGLGVERVRALNAFATGGIRPDLTVVLDVSVAQGRDRRRSAGKADDRIESEGDVFLTAVADAYRTLSGADASIEVVDGSGSEDDVHRRVRALLASRFPGPFGV